MFSIGSWNGLVSNRPQLTYWGRVTHICVSDLTIIGSDNGLSPGWRQAIIRTNAGLLLIRPLGTNFSEISIEILLFSFKKMRLKVSSAKRRPFCLGLNVLIAWINDHQGRWHHMASPGTARTNGDKWLCHYLCGIYRKTSSISRTKSQSLNVSCIIAQLSSLNPLKPRV